MGTWLNDDGLYIRYGTDEGVSTTAGTYPTMVSGMHVTELVIADMTTLSTTDAIQANTTIIPSGAFIQKVEILVDTAVTGANAILDIGLIRLDRTTELDYNGFVASAPVADFATAGNVVTYTQGSDEHGALIGTELAYAGLITASEADSNAFTAGAIRVKIYWYKA